MKSIKEKEQLIKMSLALGMEPDPKIVKEVLEYKQMMADVKKKSASVVDVFEEISKIKIEEPEPIQQVLVIPKPPSLDEISFLLDEEVVKEPRVIDEVPKPPTVDELLEQFEIVKEAPVVEEKPKNKLIDLASTHIAKEVMKEQKAAATFQEPEVPVPQSLNELKRKVKMLEEWITKISMTGPGSGEVNLLRLDDVDTSAIGDNKYLKYNSANGKIEFATVSGGGGGGSVDSVNGETGDVILTTANINEQNNLYFTNARAVSAFIAGQNISIEANGLISANISGGGGSVDFENVSSNILPTANSVFNLGSPDRRWKTLFLANNTIDLGGSLISSDGTGQILISGAGAVLPTGSRIEVGERQEKIALVGNTGAVISLVPFYTRNLGLNTIATNFEFGANPDDYVFTNFTFNNGTAIQQSRIAQFYF